MGLHTVMGATRIWKTECKIKFVSESLRCANMWGSLTVACLSLRKCWKVKCFPMEYSLNTDGFHNHFPHLENVQVGNARRLGLCRACVPAMLQTQCVPVCRYAILWHRLVLLSWQKGQLPIYLQQFASEKYCELRWIARRRTGCGFAW